MISAWRSRFWLVAALAAVTLAALRVAPPLPAEAADAAPAASVSVARGVDQDGKVTLEVEAFGLEAGVKHAVHLHAGTCDLPSASTGRLGDLVVEDERSATVLVAHAVTFAAVGEQALLSHELLDDKVVDLHDASGDVVACAAVPAR